MAERTEADRMRDRERKRVQRTRLRAAGVRVGPPLATSRKIYPRPCANCGAAYIGRAPNARFCSTRCRYQERDARPEVRARSNARQRAAYKPKPKRVKPECTQDGCSTASVALALCMRHYRARRRAEGVPWANEGNKSYKARAKRHGVEYEPVNRIRVFERDGWTCGICGQPVTRDDASLDHVRPMSKGGPHTYANTQCSHLMCNIIKRDSIPSAG